MLEIKKCSMFEMESDKNFRPLLSAYAAEVENDGRPKPCADIDMYYNMERSGIYHIWGAFLRGEMIGFIAIVANKFPHYSLLLSATESWFVHRKHRKTGAGMKLLATAKDFVGKIGCKGMIVSAPNNGPLINVLENSEECKEMGKVFFVSIDHAKS